MAVKLPDGKIARTQPEQVKKNMDDIESMKSELDIIKEGIASAYKIQGSETVADLDALEKTEEMNGYVYNMLDAGNLTNEDNTTLSVQIGDNVVLVWNNGDWYWDRLAGLVDTSNLCTLDTDQTITGVKTFKDNFKVQSANGGSTTLITQDNNSNLYFNINGSIGCLFGSGSARFKLMYPIANNTYDIGTSDTAWKDLYLSGSGNINEVKSHKFTAPDNNQNITFYRADGSTVAFMIGNYDGTTKTGYSIVPNINGTLNLGSNAFKYKDLYLNGITYLGSGTQITQSSDGSLQFTLSGDGKAVKPSWSEHYDLGAADYKWRNVYLHGNLSDGTNSVAVADIPKKILFVQATHAPQTLGTITIESYTLTADEMALIDTTKELLLCPAKTINSSSDPVMALVSYNSTTGVLQYLNYGTGVSLSEFYLMQ